MEKVGTLLHPPKHQRRIRATKPKTIRQHAIHFRVVDPLTHNRHAFHFGVEILDVGRLADEVPLHHQQRVNRFMHACGTERMAGERFRG